MALVTYHLPENLGLDDVIKEIDGLIQEQEPWEPQKSLCFAIPPSLEGGKPFLDYLEKHYRNGELFAIIIYNRRGKPGWLGISQLQSESR